MSKSDGLFKELAFYGKEQTNSDGIVVSVRDARSIYHVLKHPDMKRDGNVYMNSYNLPSPLTRFSGSFNSDGDFFQVGATIQSEKSLDPHNPLILQRPAKLLHTDKASLSQTNTSILNMGDKLYGEFVLTSLDGHPSLPLGTYEEFLSKFEHLRSVIEAFLKKVYTYSPQRVEKKIVIDIAGYDKAKYLSIPQKIVRFFPQFEGFKKPY